MLQQNKRTNSHNERKFLEDGNTEPNLGKRLIIDGNSQQCKENASSAVSYDGHFP